MMLTRAAFAVMVKFSQQEELFDTLVSSIEIEQEAGGIPLVKGKDQNDALVETL